VNRDSQLTVLADALRHDGFLPCLGQGRKKQGRQNADDGDDNQKFYQGESVNVSCQSRNFPSTSTHTRGHVGFCSGLKKAERPALTKKLEALIGGSGFTGKAPGGPSRWSTKRSTEWQPLKTKLVVEVSFDHVSGGRFRHGTRLLRWRPDKAPRQCTMEQLVQKKSRALDWLS